MAIQYVGGQNFAANLDTTRIVDFALTGGLASAPASGDIVLVFFGDGTLADKTIGVVTSGYTEIAELYVSDTYDANLSVSWKIMGATPDTNIEVSSSGGGDTTGAIIVHVFRGVDQTTPLDVTSTTRTGTNTGSVTPAAITPITTGSVIVIGGATGHNSGGAVTYSQSYLSNFLIRNPANPNIDLLMGAGHVAWTSGTYTPGIWTMSTDRLSNSYATLTLALRPSTSVSVIVSVSGYSAAAAVDVVSVAAASRCLVSGVEVNARTSDSVVSADGTAYAVGAQALGYVGITSSYQGATVSTDGVETAGYAGAVDVPSPGQVFVTGVSSSALIGTASIRGASELTLGGLFATSSLSSADVAASSNALLFTSQLDAAVGAVTVKLRTLAVLSGIYAAGHIGNITVWGEITPNQTPDYDPVDAGQVPVWSNINPVQAAGYVEIVPSENPGYSPVNPLQDVVWTPVKT